MRKSFLLLFIILSGCAVIATQHLDNLYGRSDPARYDNPKTSGSLEYFRDVKPIIDSRCVVCHGCYDAPCQLKLGSFEGIARGANPERVYDLRILAMEPARLFEDAQSTAEWRDKEFHPVLNERSDHPIANIDASVMARLLQLKNEHPLPTTEILPETFDFSLDREQQCPTIEAFDKYEEEYPLWGMPFGLPALAEHEQNTVLNWLRIGAPYQAPPPPNSALQAEIDKWERLFNQDSLKAQLINRYLYEHLFLAHIYFHDADVPNYFELVRSSTPPGKPIVRISTAFPLSDPKVARVYYRLQPHRESITVKNHQPYKLDDRRLQLWENLFYENEFEVNYLPTYDSVSAANPFTTFKQIPFDSRYRFLLDEAQFTILNFIKGPVCRGQNALNVINDYFWIAFVDPDVHYPGADVVATELETMLFPAGEGSNASPLEWVSYARQEKVYIETKYQYLNEKFTDHFSIDLNLLWDGDGNNPNAALTIYRHFDSASVEKGLLGETPQSMWIIDYPLLERIHYLLVAGYDVFANVGHQVNSRIYMDFLRMEGESNFLVLLPKKDSEATRARWYRGSVSPVEDFLNIHQERSDGHSDVEFTIDDPLNELYQKIKTQLQPVLSEDHYLQSGSKDQLVLQELQRLQSINGIPASILAQTTFLHVYDESDSSEFFYTLLSNSAHTNVSHIFNEGQERLPKEDTLSVLYGFVGAYPNIIISVSIQDLNEFVNQVEQLQSEMDYKRLLDTYGIRRSNKNFWELSDKMHAALEASTPVEAGLFDYNRLENR